VYSLQIIDGSAATNVYKINVICPRGRRWGVQPQDRVGTWIRNQNLESKGALHYAKLTGQRSVGISEQNGPTFSN